MDNIQLIQGNVSNYVTFMIQGNTGTVGDAGEAGLPGDTVSRILSLIQF